MKLILLMFISSCLCFAQIKSCDRNISEVNSNKSFAEINIVKSKNTPTNAEKFLKISQINKEKPNKGTFKTEGFVVKIYTCPVCPPDSMCKPCMGNNIVISEENKNLESYDLTEKDLIIFTDKSESFTIGENYYFNIKITEQHTTSSDYNDVELLSSEMIKN